MYNELYKEAYEKLKNEISSMAGKFLLDVNAVHESDYIGRMRALNEVFDIMTKVDNELYNALLRESEKETTYYESELAADESRSKQL